MPRVVVLVALVLALVPAAPAAAEFVSTPGTSVMTNGPVFALAQAGGKTFIGGQFTRAGTPTGSGADLGQADGAPNLSFAPPNGAVLAVASDNAGGWYIGGSFTSVGTVAADGLAHLLASGSVDPNFNPELTGTDQSVDALAVSGSTVWAGGTFTVAGTTEHLAAFDAATGAAGFEPSVAGSVYALAVSGSTLYVGGDFNAVGSPGVTRNLLAAFDTTTGLPTSFDPEVTGPTSPGIGPPSVRALAIAGATLYASGHFATVNGSVARANIAAFDLTTTGAATAFHPTTQTSSTIGALAAAGGTVYAGGNFSTLNGATANFLAAFDATTGAATTAFDATPNDMVEAIAVAGGVVYAGGRLTSVNLDRAIATRNHIAAFNASDGSVIAGFDPNLDGEVDAIAVAGTRVYAGGMFSFAGANTIYNRLAAVNADGTIDSAFNPNLNNPVSALAVSGTTLYAGGSFSTVNGSTSRNALAAFDTTSGLATAFDPHPNAAVDALVVSGGTLYAGGAFTTVNLGTPPGTTRNGLAAFDAATGTVDPTFDANVNGDVDALALGAGGLYAGGDFSTVNGGTPGNLLAKFDPATGAVDSTFDPALVGSNGVSALALSGTTLYAGGGFMPTGDDTGPTFLAAFDATTGADLAAFDPGLDGPVASLAVSGTTLYAGGSFSHANGGTAQASLAGFDASTGALDAAFAPGPINGAVNALGDSGGVLSIGGGFTSVGAVPQTNYAQFPAAAGGPPTLSVTPTSVAGGATVTATFGGVTAPTPDDWVGIFPVGAPNTGYVNWFWTSSCTQVPGATGVGSGSCAVTMPTTAGSYELRLFADNGYTVLATSATVTDAGAPPPTLSASPATVVAGGSTSVTWTGVAGATARDWVGLYQAGAANSAYLTFFYAGSCTQTAGGAAASGSCAFTMPTAPGTYEFRLFANDSFDLLATSGSVTVTKAPAPTLSAGPATVAGGATVSVSWANVGSPASTDWVALYPAGATAGQYVDWFYDSTCTRTAGTAEAAGSCGYSMPTTPGDYYFALLARDGNTVLATSGTVTVTGASIGLTATPATSAPGGRVTVSWTGVTPATGSDWIGLYAVGAANTAYVGFEYDATCTGNPAAGGAGSGSCTFTLPATDGTYELRLFAHDSFARLATSNQITVEG